jgi:integrase
VKILALYQGTAYFNFIESLHSDSTKRNYAYGLKHFLTHIQLKDPEQLLAISLDSLEDMIKKYLVFLTQVHKSNALARVNLAAIRHFCRMNKVKLDWELIYQFKGKRRAKGKDEAYLHQDINNLLAVCDLRLKAVVLIYASTGMRSGALPPLKLQDTIKMKGLYKFNVYEDDDQYFTFCSPEATEAIDQYLAYRERFGEKLTPQSPLLRDDFGTKGFGRKKPRHITSASITTVLTNKLEKLGIREADHVNGSRSRKKVKLLHGFRKFFETQLLESDVNYVVVKMLMGHDLKLEESYFRPKLDFIIKEYKKAVNNLTINPEARLKTENDNLKMEKIDYQSMREQLAIIKDKLAQLS